jgi:hypothetical protein
VVNVGFHHRGVHAHPPPRGHAFPKPTGGIVGEAGKSAGTAASLGNVSHGDALMIRRMAVLNSERNVALAGIGSAMLIE